MKLPKSIQNNLVQWSYSHKDASKNLIKLKQTVDDLSKSLPLKKEKK